MPKVPDNVYFELTAAFNSAGRIAVLASGQAVVWYRLAMMSKDGDWILRETAAACQRVREVLTTDPDRILELAAEHGQTSRSPPVRAAVAGRERLAVVVALAEEIDRLQQRDRARVERYERASTAYRDALRRLARSDLRLPGGHDRLLALAERWLPAALPGSEETRE